MCHWHRHWAVLNALLLATRAYAYILLNTSDSSFAASDTFSSTSNHAPSDPFVTHEDYYEIQFSRFHTPASIAGPVILFVDAAARYLADEMQRQRATNISSVPGQYWHYIGANSQRFQLTIFGDKMLVPMIYAEVWTIMAAIRSYIGAWGPNDHIQSAVIDFFDHGFHGRFHAAEGLLELGPLRVLPQPMETTETS